MLSSSRSPLESAELKTYSLGLSLDGLVAGVDNVRYDVSLGSKLSKATADLAFRLLSEHSRAQELLRTERSKGTKERADFREICNDVLTAGINRARTDHQVEIDLLTQTAVAKMLILEANVQYESLVRQLKGILRRHETSDGQHSASTIQIRDQIGGIQQNRKDIIYGSSRALFSIFASVQSRGLGEIREANFGTQSLLPLEIFTNPLLQAESPFENHLTMENYGLIFGSRIGDPDTYDAVLQLVRRLYGRIRRRLREAAETPLSQAAKADPPEPVPTPDEHDVDPFIMEAENVGVLLNCFESLGRYRHMRRQKRPKAELAAIRERAKSQKRRLVLFCRAFERSELMQRITAYSEMQPLCQEYSPAMTPYQVLEFLVSPKLRKEMTKQLRQLRKVYRKPFPLAPLNRLVRDLDKVKARKRQEYLIKFLEGFARFHRDLYNLNLLKQGMDAVNLASDEKILKLSRANNTLYDLQLQGQQKIEERLVINHVIIKADVRGSTDITYRMKERGQNPASFFSLNFFDPISDVLYEYGASKVFIEGDAIILAILEEGDNSEGWYSVARACGLAIQMLSIIRRSNVKSKKEGLPILELGIGVVFHAGTPTFLFDGTTRIMISPAINLADRLSASMRSVREELSGSRRPFNLYLYQSAAKKPTPDTADDTFLRYNVNGIQLNEEGFERLSDEISLSTLSVGIPELQDDEIKIYTGKFPTVSGSSQRLVIRETPIPEVEPGSLKVVRYTDRSYYEVCTHPKLYEHVRRRMG